MYSSNYVLEKLKEADFWSNVGWQIDTLTPLVKFIVSYEITETDLESLLFSRETCLKEMRRLIFNKENPGKKAFFQKLLMLLKESPGPDTFVFDLAIPIWKYLWLRWWKARVTRSAWKKVHLFSGSCYSSCFRQVYC